MPLRNFSTTTEALKTRWRSHDHFGRNLMIGCLDHQARHDNGCCKGLCSTSRTFSSLEKKTWGFEKASVISFSYRCWDRFGVLRTHWDPPPTCSFYYEWSALKPTITVKKLSNPFPARPFFKEKKPCVKASAHPAYSLW